jgi:hypothetical protein
MSKLHGGFFDMGTISQHPWLGQATSWRANLLN